MTGADWVTGMCAAALLWAYAVLLIRRAIKREKERRRRELIRAVERAEKVSHC